MTWKDGRALVLKRLEKDSLPIDLFIKSISMGSETKFVPGDAVFLTGTPKIVPHAMLHNIKHNKVLHETQHHGNGYYTRYSFCFVTRTQ